MTTSLERVARGAVLISGLFAVAAHAMSAGQWEQDLGFLVEKLTTVHPEPYRETSKEDFDKAVKSLRDDIPQLKDHEIAVRMMQLVSLIGDGHTGLDPQGEVAGFDHWFPVRIERFQEGYFITATRKAQQGLIGAQVLRIGDLVVQEATARVNATVNGDNPFTHLYYGGYALAMPKALAALGINKSVDELSLGVRDRNGKEQQALVPAIAKPFGLLWFWLTPGVPGTDSLAAPLVAPEKLALTFQHADQLYWSKYLPKTRTYYANIHLILNMKDTHFPGFTAPTPTLAEFFTRMWTEVDHNKVDRVVLDIRNNGGGNNQLLGPLIAGFEARPNLNQRGRVFVITGRRTYSAAMNLVALLEQRTHAIFVGEPAGGSPRHSGDATSFTLPHSKMTVNVSVFSWDLGAAPWDVRDRVQPELVVPPRAESYFSGRDPAMDAIEAYSKSGSSLDRMTRAFDQGGIGAALTLLDRQRQSEPDSLWNAYEYLLWQLADRLDERGDQDAAVKATLQRATQLYPNSWRAWFRLGLFHYQRGQWKEAVDGLTRATALNTHQSLLRRLLAASTK